jgi:hypothetical protein
MLRSGKDFGDPFACRGITVYGTHQTGGAKLMLVEMAAYRMIFGDGLK